MCLLVLSINPGFNISDLSVKRDGAENVESSGVSTYIPPASMRVVDPAPVSSVSSSPLVFYLLFKTVGVRLTMSTL